MAGLPTQGQPTNNMAHNTFQPWQGMAGGSVLENSVNALGRGMNMAGNPSKVRVSPYQTQQQQAYTYNPATMNAAQSNAQINAPQINAYTGQAQGYNAPTLGPAQGYTGAQGQAQGYTPGQLGGPAQYGAEQAQGTSFDAAKMQSAQFGPSAQAKAQGYNAPQMGQAQGYGSASFDQGMLRNIGAGQVSQTNLDPYMNPYTQQVIDSTNRELTRQNDIALNKIGSQAEAAGAFGGSRHGIVESEQNRNLLDQIARSTAQLNESNFLNAQGQAQFDIGKRLQADQSNQSAGLQVGAYDQNAENAARQFSAQAQNNRDFQQAGLNAQAGQFGAQAQNMANLANAGYDQQRMMAQGQADNAANAANAGYAQAANQFAANSGFQAGMQNAQLGTGANAANAGAQNQFGLAQFGADNAAGQFNAGAQNTMSGLNMASQNAANQFGASAGNQFGLTQFGADTDAARYGADADNNMTLANLGFLNNAATQNAGNNLQGQLANMQNSQFNAGNIQAGNLANMGALNNAGQWNAGNLTNVSGNNANSFNNMLGNTQNLQYGAATGNADRNLSAANTLGQLANLGFGQSNYQTGLEMDAYRQQQQTMQALMNAAGQMYGNYQNMPYEMQQLLNSTFAGAGAIPSSSSSSQSPGLLNLITPFL